MSDITEHLAVYVNEFADTREPCIIAKMAVDGASAISLCVFGTHAARYEHYVAVKGQHYQDPDTGKGIYVESGYTDTPSSATETTPAETDSTETEESDTETVSTYG